MADLPEQEIKEAVDRVWEFPHGSGEYSPEFNRRAGFWRRVSSIAKSINLDLDELRVSRRKVIMVVKDVLVEVGRRVDRKDESIDISKVFDVVKDEMFSERFGSALTTYSIIFPLHMQVQQSCFDHFDLNETKLDRIEYEAWEEQYVQQALDSESSNFESFFEENPNDPDVFTWSYWQVDYDARDPDFAINKVQETLQLLMAEVNFMNYQWTNGIPRHSSNSHPRDRWSHLQLPFTFLAFEGEEFQTYLARDYDYRGSMADRTITSTIECYHDLPGLFLADRDSFCETDHLLFNALIAFQEGMTEPRVRRSFFDFWRGIEHLVGQEGLSNHEIVQRSEFALYFVGDFGDGLLPEMQQAIGELDAARNNLTHRWPDARISRNDRNAAKVLLDGLITLYLEYRDEWDLSDFHYLLEYGAMKRSTSKIEKIIETLERLDVI